MQRRGRKEGGETNKRDWKRINEKAGKQVKI
jgi:hypothetical protein